MNTHGMENSLVEPDYINIIIDNADILDIFQDLNLYRNCRLYL